MHTETESAILAASLSLQNLRFDIYFIWSLFKIYKICPMLYFFLHNIFYFKYVSVCARMCKRKGQKYIYCSSDYLKIFLLITIFFFKK